jgi:hypothetical protein
MCISIINKVEKQSGFKAEKSIVMLM